MRIGIINEEQDKRVALVPEGAKQLTAEKNSVKVESGAGISAFFDDEAYTSAGAEIADRKSILSNSDMLLLLAPPRESELDLIPKGTILVSSFQPFLDHRLIDPVIARGHTAISMDMIPRITLAQSMDMLSSMASLAGYKAVIEAAGLLPRYFPMLTTAAGSIPPAKVLVIGAGVAGLQAIATAKRLGASVEAFDTRTAAREEVQSLGAKFVEVEGAREDKAAGGYAVEQTEEFKQKQHELIAQKAEKADVIITTAQIRGRKAPVLITGEMIKQMKPGSVIVDIAASTGGNCELTVDGKTIVEHQVTIVGNSFLSSEVSVHASQLYSKNMCNFMKVLLKEGEAVWDWENPIIKSACTVYNGELRAETK
ncbi:MAG: Re/Si-specific NAD(P)(+) transhydrogenase subunit alpha [Balneolales bacterium]|nr:Re/Si-specific NAD(P)(+) transhydrogenase subunit alpha [Balneolales bacterium]